jgi:hypothetical protein
MMIPGDDLPPLLRIEMASYLGRADEIAEKHDQMPPLAGWAVGWLRLRTTWPGSSERNCALCAESSLGWVFEIALLT